MLDSLTDRDVIIAVVTILLSFVLYRGAQFIKTQDKYLSWAHIINPGLVVISLIVVMVFISRTERMWYNLVAINEFKVDNPTISWGKSLRNDSIETSFIEKYQDDRADWPIGMLTDPKDTSQRFMLLAPNVKDSFASFKHYENIYWSQADSSIVQEDVRVVNLSALKLIDSLQLKIQELNQNVLLMDSLYSMKIDTWLVSDSLRVKFMSEKEQSNTN